MLDSWAMRNSAWKKKRLVRSLWEDAAHKGAKCFHALSESEYRSMRAFDLRNQICVIPNGMDLPEDRSCWSEVGGFTSDLGYLTSGKKTVLYLGRLHPKKNLGPLLRAWKQTFNLQPSTLTCRWQLAIAGWDQGGYRNELERLKEELAIGDSVSFAGPRFGEEKQALYRRCDAFILPSLSEGLPMVVLEAWAYGKPVLMTPECNLPEGFAANAALQIGTTPETIATGLGQLFEMSESDRRAMGAKGRALVDAKFSWPRIGEQMRALYEWVLGGGTPPATVRMD